MAELYMYLYNTSENNVAKMNSLYQTRSKMLHGTKVIILVGKKIEKEMAWLGCELTTLIL